MTTIETTGHRGPAALPPLTSLIGGNWHACGTGVPVLNKYTRRVITEVGEATHAHVELAVSTGTLALRKGAPTPFARARILERTATILDRERERIVELMIAETGFTAVDATTEIDRAMIVLRICAEEATRIVGEAINFSATPGQHDRMGFTIRVPRGIVCAITPFNSPLYTVCHKVAPALAAGNPVILKPSELTPLTAIVLCEAFLEAGLPPDFLSLLHGPGDRVGPLLVEQQEIAFFSFTGSTRVGRLIQRQAGLRKTQMELGSISSTIICADANLDAAIPKISSASFRKAGQVCMSVQRLYVDQCIFDEALVRLKNAADEMPVGDPADPATKVGPMISEQAAIRAQEWIDEAKTAHADVVRGGSRTDSVMMPTILTNVCAGMKVFDHEIFAPCVAVVPFTSFDAVLADANNTPFGLSAGIFTTNIHRALEAARTLRFGSVHINETSSARADAMPFGGVKESGFGHEGPRYAIRELTEERLITFNQ